MKDLHRKEKLSTNPLVFYAGVKNLIKPLCCPSHYNLDDWPRSEGPSNGIPLRTPPQETSHAGAGVGALRSEDRLVDAASQHPVLCFPQAGTRAMRDHAPGGGEELVCAAWRRIAVGEPALWRCIDIFDRDGIQRPPLPAQRATVRAAVDRSAGQCVAFSGPLDDELLVHLVDRYHYSLLLNFNH
ncbi:hypothetical protein HU200_056134 [Digitaria exilis]|uniref:Uncharacterized protein n=1 Tax=Digitaria exilis TaxID=1010633 RepID=A0A835E424_9POAL|nr:hypothetical protein HU200_056134 [Digitaria exilis]